MTNTQTETVQVPSVDGTRTFTEPVRYWFAGSPYLPGTNVPANVTGECNHHHRSPEAAQRCIDAMDRSIKAGHGPNAYCDRVVMAATWSRGSVAW